MAQVDVSAIPETYLKLAGRFWLRPIRTEEELDVATKLVNELAMRDDMDEAEEDYFDVLTDLIEAYESEHYPMEQVSGLEMIKFFIEDRDLSQAEVARGAGMPTSTLNDLLMGRRKLNLKHIQAFAKYFRVNPAVFMHKDEDA